MATFLKLLTRQKRPIRSINALSTHKSKISTTASKHIKPVINLNHRFLPHQSIRHNSDAQTQSNDSNIIKTCTNSTKPASQRGANRPNLANIYSVGQTVEGDFTVIKITPIPSYDCTAYEVN